MTAPIEAEHANWCHTAGHGSCCGAECDCGADKVNAELASLRGRIASVNDWLNEWEQYVADHADDPWCPDEPAEQTLARNAARRMRPGMGPLVLASEVRARLTGDGQ